MQNLCLLTKKFPVILIYESLRAFLKLFNKNHWVNWAKTHCRALQGWMACMWIFQAFSSKRLICSKYFYWSYFYYSLLTEFARLELNRTEIFKLCLILMLLNTSVLDVQYILILAFLSGAVQQTCVSRPFVTNLQTYWPYTG